METREKVTAFLDNFTRPSPTQPSHAPAYTVVDALQVKPGRAGATDAHESDSSRQPTRRAATKETLTAAEV